MVFFLNTLQMYINKKFKIRKTISFFQNLYFLTLSCRNCKIIHDLCIEEVLRWLCSGIVLNF